MKSFKIIFFSLIFLFVIPFVLSSANYGEGAYGAGIYGQASCGDGVCDASESCSICSVDCGVCATSGSGVREGLPVEKKFFFDIITVDLGAVLDDFNEDVGINEIKIEVNQDTQNVEITVTRYSSRPNQVIKDAPGIVYKYLEIETENLESNLREAIITLQVEKDWISEKFVDADQISLYKFDEGLDEWSEFLTNLISGDEKFNFYQSELDSFSFFAISGKIVTQEIGEEELIITPDLGFPKEIDFFDEINLKTLQQILVILGIIVLIVILTILIVRFIKKRRIEKNLGEFRRQELTSMSSIKGDGSYQITEQKPGFEDETVSKTGIYKRARDVSNGTGLLDSKRIRKGPFDNEFNK